VGFLYPCIPRIVNLSIFNHLKNEKILDQIIEFDKEEPKEVRKDLFNRCKNLFKHDILEKIQEKSPEIVFITTHVLQFTC
jgi:hypothetical protein